MSNSWIFFSQIVLKMVALQVQVQLGAIAEKNGIAINPENHFIKEFGLDLELTSWHK